jgi:hypothetical protein
VPRGRTIRTPQKRGKFLENLRKHGNVTIAAKSIGSAHRTVYDWRADDPTFKEEWDDAMRQYSTVLEAEADRRAVEGTRRPVYYQGQVVGYVDEYSDTLLMFRLKKLDPQGYKDRVEHSGDEDHPVVIRDPEARNARINSLISQASPELLESLRERIGRLEGGATEQEVGLHSSMQA